MSRWGDGGQRPRGHDYDSRWDALAAAGEEVHGEAELIESLLIAARAESPSTFGSVLDAGCGTGRVAIELALRGLEVVGVDLDPNMLDTAREKAPELEWHLGDLAAVDLGSDFDLVAAAGNVMIFLAPGSEQAVVANLVRHLRKGGLLVAGFQVGPGRLSLDDYDSYAEQAGLKRCHRWSTWQQDPYDGGDYAVSVHRRRGTLA